MKIIGGLAILLCVAGCSQSTHRTNRTGKYVYAMDLNLKGIPLTQKWQTEWVDLKADGSYSARNGRLAASGRYKIQGDQIRFTSPTKIVYKGHFRQDVLELDEPCFGIKLSSDQSSPEDYFIRNTK